MLPVQRCIQGALFTYRQRLKVGVHQVIGPCPEENLSHNYINPQLGWKPEFVQPPAKKWGKYHADESADLNSTLLPFSNQLGKQESKTLSDTDFLKSTQLISSLALITLKNNFSPPLEVQVGGNSCSIPLFVGGGNKEWQQILLNWPRVWRLREIITPTTRLPIIIRLWLAGPPSPDRKSLCLIGWKKPACTPQEAWGSHTPPVRQPRSAVKIRHFPTPETQYSHKASNISVRQSGSSSSIGRARLSQPHLLVWHSLTNNLASGKKRKRQWLFFWLLK